MHEDGSDVLGNTMAGSTATSGAGAHGSALPGSGSGGHAEAVPVAGTTGGAGAVAQPSAGSTAQLPSDAGTPNAGTNAGAGGRSEVGDAAVSSGTAGAQPQPAGAGNAGAAGMAGTNSDSGAGGAGGNAGNAAAGGAGAPAAAGGGAGAETGGGGAASQAGAGGVGGNAAAGSGGSNSQAGVGGAGGDAAGAGAGGSAGNANAGSGGSPAPVPCSGPPGLYAGTTCTDLAPGVEAFTPQFPLITDDGKGNLAVKARWIYLPPGSVIDTSNPNRWAFPVGTIFFKEFADPKTHKRVETRRLQKTAASPGYASWSAQSYAWSNDQLSVSVASSSGVPNALGSGFDIPSTNQCKQCHQLVGTTNVDAVVGFNAIQLNHDLGGLDLATLLLRGQLTNVSDPAHPNVSLDNAVVPGNAVQRAGIGYLHGNCSHCHGGPSPHGHQLLWTPLGMTSVTDLPMFGSGMTGAVCHCLDLWQGHSDGSTTYRLRINPGSGSSSGIIGRMSVNAVSSPRDAMPPVGRKGADAAGIATVEAFIDSLDGSACRANPPACAR